MATRNAVSQSALRNWKTPSSTYWRQSRFPLQRRPLFFGSPLRLAAHEEVFRLKLVEKIEEERRLESANRLAGVSAAGSLDQERDEKARSR
jgi:hypothetical protein